YDSKSFPATGSPASVVSGTKSTANAGPAWIAGNFYHSGWDAGHILVSALLLDDGTLAAQKDDMQVLFATAEVFANTIPGDDRITPLQQGLTYTLGVLHLANPARWSAKAVDTRIFSASDYDALYIKAANTTAGILWKIAVKHDSGGSDYSVFYNVPSAIPQYVPVKLRVVRLVAEGPGKDTENGLADFVSEIAIGGASLEHEFAQDNNDLSPDYLIWRKMFAGQTVHVTIEIRERDAAPAYGMTSGAWGGCRVCCEYGTLPTVPAYMKGCLYVGPCGPVQHLCDVNPKPKESSGSGWGSVTHENATLELDYNMVTGAITGDLTGAKGQVLTSHGDAQSPRRAMIQLKIE
ncbi:MAG: hypothetical protein V1750_08270, partial [Acidobacteriota bacterium]